MSIETDKLLDSLSTGDVATEIIIGKLRDEIATLETEVDCLYGSIREDGYY